MLGSGRDGVASVVSFAGPNAPNDRPALLSGDRGWDRQSPKSDRKALSQHAVPPSDGRRGRQYRTIRALEATNVLTNGTHRVTLQEYRIV